jgi:hypothetical protein
MIGRQRNGRVRFAGTRVCDAYAIRFDRSSRTHMAPMRCLPPSSNSRQPRWRSWAPSFTLLCQRVLMRTGSCVIP